MTGPLHRSWGSQDDTMSLLDSLLDAIVRLGGDALVMHVGERPYVTTSSSLDAFRGPLAWGQVELSSRPLTTEAVLSMLGQMLPADMVRDLDDLGAVEHGISSPDGQHQFLVVAAKGGDDVWVEVRRKIDPAAVAEEATPELVAASDPSPAAAPPSPSAAEIEDERQAAVRAALEEREADIRAEAESREAQLRAEFEAQQAELRRSLESRESELRADAVAAAEAREAQLRAEFEAQQSELRRSLESRESELRAAFEARESELHARFAAQQAELQAALERRQSELRDALEARVAEIRSQAQDVERREADLRTLLEQRERDAHARAAELESQLAQIRSALEARDAELRAMGARADEARAAETKGHDLRAQAVAEAEARESQLRAEFAAQQAELRQTMEARERDARAEAVAAAGAREAELRAEFDARETALRLTLETREGELHAEAASLLERRQAEIAHEASETLARREQELISASSASLAEHRARVEQDLASRERAMADAEASVRAGAATLAEAERALAAQQADLQALRALLEERESALAGLEAAAARSLAERTADVEASFVLKMAETEARLAERESALGAEFERRLSDAVAAATREIEERFALRQEQLAVEAAAAADAERAAIAAADAHAAHLAFEQAAREAEAQAVREAEAQAEARTGAEEHLPVEAAAANDESRPLAVLLPRGVTIHSSTSALLEILSDGLERGASAVYAVAGSRPLLRIEGEITSPGSLPVLQAADLERFAFEFAPRDDVAHSTSEWTAGIPGVGRVRCVSFEDASGRGLVFHLSANVAPADELGLSREIQALCNEPDGLIVLAGPRASGKSTLLGAFVDRINRSRSDHVITIESRVRTLHERRHSLISQREVDGEGTAIARAARAALREGPDVLAIDDARSPEAIAVAIDAARAGRLVFVSMPAPNTTAAVERLTEAFSVERRPQVRALLSGALRAVISQVLVPRIDGGRVGAREVLLSSPPVAQLILDGAYQKVPIAIEGGRRLGMCTLTDSLVALVRDGVVAPAEALRNAPNRPAMVATLQQEGIDVSELERRA